MSKPDKHIDEITAELNQAVDELDELTVSRLRAARKQALEAASRDSRRWGGRRRWLPAAGLAAMCLVVALVAVQWWPGDTNQATLLAAQDMDIMMSRDDLDMYSNMEFYQWLDRTHAG